MPQLLNAIAEVIVEVKKMSIRRQGFSILQDIDLKIFSEQHLAIIGPNGAGKSFLLRVLSADMIPSQGEVTLLGKTFGKTNLWELRKKIGFVSSRLAFWYEGNTTVLEVVCSGYHGTFALTEEVTEEQKKHAINMLAFFEMDGFCNHLFETLSDGERRKVLLSRAMVVDPQLFIFDEPCQGLDIPSRDRFLEDVDRLAEKTPLIYVTHHLEELPRCITDVFYLKHGRFFLQGKKEDMLSSEHMSAVFDMSLIVSRSGERWYVRHGSEVY